ncbi:hypothetical protein Vadar_016736 [Vaccinium darrowii]|uniref:Uncharacterized protein n=1 Tax=Vaccinium darrowii TaxID=229202 RepID=A0ACB7YEL8_9ERIC|nr:hypothetical protein Vadar_016736 [Vaccinium darrowii]
MTRKPVTASERRKRTEATNSEPSKQEISCIPQKKKLRLKSKAKEITPLERFPEQDEEMICQPVTADATERERTMQSKEKETLNEEPCTDQQQEVIIHKRFTASERQRRMQSKQNKPTNEEPCAEHDKVEEVVEEEARDREEQALQEEALQEEVVDQECQGRRRKRHRNRRGQAEVDANQPTIGPKDPRLLIGFKDHVAAHILRGRERGVLKVYCHSSTLKKWTITNKRLQQRINQSSLLSLCKATYPYCNKVLLSAFVEKRHPETNSFHLDFGEMGITRDDVHQLIGIPITGSAIWTPEKDNLTLLQTFLGVIEGEAKEALIHGGVTFGWLRGIFSYVSDDDLVERVDCCARAYLLYVLGSTLFVDKMGVRVMFDPYKNEKDVLPDISFYTGCIHYLSVVEPYMPDRVLRHLGLVQSILGPPIAPERGGKGGGEWMYKFWENWENHLLSDDKGVFVRPGVPWECTPDYLPWFRKVSHYRVGPDRGAGEGTRRAAERITKAVALLDGALDMTGISMRHLRQTLVQIRGVLTGTT